MSVFLSIFISSLCLLPVFSPCASQHSHFVFKYLVKTRTHTSNERYQQTKGVQLCLGSWFLGRQTTDVTMMLCMRVLLFICVRVRGHMRMLRVAHDFTITTQHDTHDTHKTHFTLHIHTLQVHTTTTPHSHTSTNTTPTHHDITRRQTQRNKQNTGKEEDRQRNTEGLECRFLFITQLMFLEKEKDPTSMQFDDDEWIRSLKEAQEVTTDVPEDSATYDQQDVDPKTVRPIRSESSCGNTSRGDSWHSVREKLQPSRNRCGRSELVPQAALSLWPSFISSSTMNAESKSTRKTALG